MSTGVYCCLELGALDRESTLRGVNALIERVGGCISLAPSFISSFEVMVYISCLRRSSSIVVILNFCVGGFLCILSISVSESF